MSRKKRSVVWSISKEDLEKYVVEIGSFSGILKKCGLFPHGNNQETLKSVMDGYGIDYSIIYSNIYKRKKELKAKCSIDTILVENSSYSRGSLKKRLLKSGILKNACYICGIGPIWNNIVLSLQIDHINGIHNDNRLENLRILCPNCHSQTESFSGKRKKISVKSLRHKRIIRKNNKCFFWGI